MEESKNSNNSPVNQPGTVAVPKNIPTVAGALIILIVAVIISVGIMYIFQTDFYGNYSANNPIMPDKALKAKTETTNAANKQDETASPTQVKEEAVEPAAKATFDFDSELKKLDDQNNSVDADDFNETEMSDANIGL